MQFITNEPALFHKGALIIGDTHFGIEAKLKEEGVHYENVSEYMLEKIFSLVKQTSAKKLIILGDVKENISYVDPITKKIFEKIQEKIPVIVVRGNHDGGIESICNDVKPSEGYLFHDLGLIHGNAWPSQEVMQARYLLAAHQHPQIELTDKLGKRFQEPAWFILPKNNSIIEKYYKKYNEQLELILVPAFNPLAGKSLKLNAQFHLGPLLHNKLFKLDDALVFLLQGTVLGKLKKLRSG